jgi:two-component system response regulator
MSRVSGFEVLRRLKDDPRLRSIPVVIFTSSREPSDIAEAYRLGANSYVVKPLDPDAFAALVAAIGAYWLSTNQALI